MIFYIFLLLFILGIYFLTLSTYKQNKESQKRYRIEHSLKRYYHGRCITPNSGEFFVRVSEHQWVQVIWHKKEKNLTINTPPDEWERREKYPIVRIESNWKLVSEHQPKPVTVEEYFIRQVM